MYRHTKRCFFLQKKFWGHTNPFFFVTLQLQNKLFNPKNTNNKMKKTLLFGMTFLIIGIFASCEKSEDNTPTIVHNKLYQTYWECSYHDDGHDGEFFWYDSYRLNLDFLTDTLVRVFGSHWYLDNGTLKGYSSSDYNDTLEYVFSSGEGFIYGYEDIIWSGIETQLRYDDNSSLQIKTRKGFKTMEQKERN